MLHRTNIAVRVGVGSALATLAGWGMATQRGLADCPLLADAALYITDDQPQAVAIADLDGDLDLDVAIANTLSGTVSVLLNLGNGAFGPEESYVVGNAPVDVVLADLDGDTDIDLATADAQSNVVAVRLNRGDGTFERRETYPAGGRPSSLAAGDLDGDDDLDVVVTNSNVTTLSVLPNLGGGVFGSRETVGVGNNPDTVEIADLDGDDDFDMVATNRTDDTVSVLRNVGSGRLFEPDYTYPVGDGPRGMAIADFDTDGLLDVAVANFAEGAGNSLSVLLNNGNSTFADQRVFETGEGPRGVASGDLNNDGRPDLAVTQPGADGLGTTLAVLLNLGEGDFAERVEFASGGDGPHGIAAADLNSDGFDDVAVANSGSDTVGILLYQGFVFTVQPEDLVVAEGQPSVFTVEVFGPGPFEYQWRRDGEDLVDAGSVSGSQTPTLTIYPSTVADSGDYDAVVTSNCGSLESASVELIVSDGEPLIDVDATCPTGGPVTLSWVGATPRGQIAVIYAQDLGAFVIPEPLTCAGTTLGLGSTAIQVAFSGSAGLEGSGQVESSATAGVCGHYLQMLDTPTCTVSNVVQIK